MKTALMIFVTIVNVMASFIMNPTHQDDFKKAEWLIGTWENKTHQGSIYETWKKQSTSELSGMSYMIGQTDTVIFETIQIVFEAEEIFYIAAVRNQNKGLPVRFACKSITESEMVFENLNHDFPNLISYSRITSDSLVAEISGTKNGQVYKQLFPFKKCPN